MLDNAAYRLSRRIDFILYSVVIAWGAQFVARPYLSTYRLLHLHVISAPVSVFGPPRLILAGLSIALGIAGIATTWMRRNFWRRVCAVLASGWWTYSLVGSLAEGFASPDVLFYAMGLALVLPTATGRPAGGA